MDKVVDLSAFSDADSARMHARMRGILVFRYKSTTFEWDNHRRNHVVKVATNERAAQLRCD